MNGRYELLEQIGEGGMGAVYKAKDRELNRIVALKVIRPDLANRPDIIARFKQEVILARSVTHKNVVRIHDIGESDGMKFITMDYIEGVDLKTALQKRGRFASEEALKIVAQVCEALEAAHAEEVIHRDLKPQNVMLDSRGKVFVLDFGIARALDATPLTAGNTVMGTPGYMSPEQMQGIPADARSDIYAVGLILKELVANDTGDTSRIIQKALEQDPSRRYQSAAEMLADIQPAPRKGKFVPALAVVAAAVIIAFSMAMIYLRPAKALNERDWLLLADLENKTGDATLDSVAREAVALQLGQSPFLNIVPDARVQDALRFMKRQPADRITRDVGREICERESIKAILSGDIAPLGNQFVVSLNVDNCDTGETLAREQMQAASKEELLRTLGQAGSSLRSKLGDLSA
jgi:predicted Ser/Thr protein kinase